MGTEEVAWIVAIAGCVIGFGSLFHMAYIRAAWPRAAGRVVGNVAEWSKSGSTRQDVYFAKISFVARDGRTYEVKGDVGRSAPWSNGQRIDLQYNESNPEHALSMNIWQQLIFSGVFIAFGLVCWAKIGGAV